MTSLTKLLEEYLAGPDILRRAIAGMTRQQLQARPIAGKWSTLEIICHLADSEQTYAHRMKRVIAEERPLLIGYDEARFAARLPYHDCDLEEEFALFEVTRRQIARVLRALPPEAFARTGVHNETGLVTLEDLLTLEVKHVPHHVRFIEEKRKALGLSA